MTDKRETFIGAGVKCIYVSEYMKRPALQSKVVRRVASSVRQGDVYQITFDTVDSKLGDGCFVEVGPTAGLTDPQNIIPVRVYMDFGAWDSSPLKYEVHVVENGFLCTEAGFLRVFA
jgi:hypothetical protein